MSKDTERRAIRLAGVVLGLGLVAVGGSEVAASTFTGKVLALRFNTGSTPARVSVLVGPHGSPCGNPNWYAFENAGSVLGQLWATALREALLHQRTVRIVGTGICDGYVVEGIREIDLQ